MWSERREDEKERIVRIAVDEIDGVTRQHVSRVVVGGISIGNVRAVFIERVSRVKTRRDGIRSTLRSLIGYENVQVVGRDLLHEIELIGERMVPGGESDAQ